MRRFLVSSLVFCTGSVASKLKFVTSALLVLLGLSLSSFTLNAQVSYLGTHSVISGLASPQQIAFDAQGSIYFDDGNGHVLKVNPTTYAQTVIKTLTSGQVGLGQGIAVDSNGLIYLASGFDGSVYTVTQGGVLASWLPSNVTNAGKSLALDGKGSLYETLATTVIKINIATKTFTTVASGLGSATGICLDASGNLYIADYRNNNVVKVVAGGSPTIVASGLQGPSGVAVDAAGNLYVADAGDWQVRVFPATGLPYVGATPPFSPNNIALDASGLLYIVGDTIDLVGGTPGSVGHTPVGTPITAAYSFFVTAGTTIAAESAFTLGVTNGEYTVSQENCVALGSAGGGCTVTIRFAPTTAGLRPGGFVFSDASGNSLFSASVGGFGDSAMSTFDPAPTLPLLLGTIPVTVGGLSRTIGTLGGSFTDTQNRTYVTDQTNLALMKITNGNAVSVSTANYALLMPTGVTMDGLGNLYVGDSAANQILKITPSGTVSILVSGMVSGSLIAPQQMLIASDGSLVFTDQGAFRMVKVATDGTTSVINLGGSGTASGIASDRYNFYVSDCSNKRILQVPVSGSPIIYVQNFPVPTCNLAMDAGGGMYVAGGGFLYRTPPGGTPVKLSAGGYTPGKMLSLDGAGNVYLQDATSSSVIMLESATPPTVQFHGVAINATSAAQVITVASSGSNYNYYPSGPVLTGSSFADTSTCNGPVGAGTTCTVSLTYHPIVAGISNETATLTSFALYSPHVINISGATASGIVSLAITQLPTTTTAGAQNTFLLTALGVGGQVLTTYFGTVHFTSTDQHAVLPADYAYLPSDNGVHTFTVAFQGAQLQRLTATDAISGVSPVSDSKSTTVAASAPIHIVAQSGSGQTSGTSTTYSSPMVAFVTDVYGNAVTARVITFTAPSLGASAVFPGLLLTYSVPSDINGLAKASFSANSQPGPFTVVADGGFGVTANFAETNFGLADVVTMSASPSASIYGQPVTLSVFVSPAAAASVPPTGNISIDEGGNALLAGLLGPAGGLNAGYAGIVPNLSTGLHHFLALYAGDPTYGGGSSAPFSYTVGKASSAMSGPAQPVSVSSGQSGSVSVPITGQYAGVGIALPTGSVTYSIGSSSSVTVPITASVATISIPNTTAVGFYTVTINYGGDSNYLPAAAVVFQLGYGIQTQMITFPALTSPTVLSYQSITLAATASSGLPVTYMITGPAISYGSIITVTGVGTITVKADQAGNASFQAAAQVVQTVVISQATPVILWDTLASIVYGTPLSAAQQNATVANIGPNQISGTYTYQPVAGSVLTPGRKILAVTFHPTDTVDFADVSSTNSISVTPASTQVALQLSPGPYSGTSSVLNTYVPITMKFNLTHGGSGVPTGYVQVKTDTLSVNYAVAANLAGDTLRIPDLGDNHLNIQYLGDSNFSASNISSVALSVGKPTFAVSYVGSFFLGGNTTTSTVPFTVTSTYGYNGTISLTNVCSKMAPQLPSYVACSMSTTSVYLDGSNTPQVYTVTIYVPQPNGVHFTWLIWPLFGLGALGFKRKKLELRLISRLVGSTVLLAAIGCGCPTNINASAGSYVLTIPFPGTAVVNTASQDQIQTATITLSITPFN